MKISGLTASLSLSAAALAGATALQAQGISYAPGAAQYRISTVSKSTSEMQGQTQEVETTLTQRVSVNLTAKSKDTLQFVITVDSAKATSSNPMVPTPDVSKLIGAKITGTMSPAGKTYAVVPATGGDEMAALVEGFSHFLIALPKGAGTATVDTLNNKVTTNGVNVTRNIVTTAKIVGDTTYAGEKAWRVQRNTTLAVNGSGEAQGQAITLAGTGDGAAMYFVSAKGVYLGSNATQNLNMTIQVPGANLEIPQKQVTTTTVERITK